FQYSAWSAECDEAGGIGHANRLGSAFAPQLDRPNNAPWKRSRESVVLPHATVFLSAQHLPSIYVLQAENLFNHGRLPFSIYIDHIKPVRHHMALRCSTSGGSYPLTTHSSPYYFIRSRQNVRRNRNTDLPRR